MGWDNFDITEIVLGYYFDIIKFNKVAGLRVIVISSRLPKSEPVDEKRMVLSNPAFKFT